MAAVPLHAPAVVSSCNYHRLLLRPMSYLLLVPTSSPNPCRSLSLFHSKSAQRMTYVSAMARRLAFKADDYASADDLRFEAPLKIIEYPDPVLRARNKNINTFDDNLKRLAEEMFDIMYKTDGIGLSAPQVGMNLQLMVFNPVGEPGKGEEVVLVNPKISRFSKKCLLYEEGCLSFPGMYGDIERPVSVKIDARDITGARFSISLSGLPSRVFQHEFDHLQGTLFFERMSEDVLDSVRPHLKAFEKKYEEKTGLSSPENIDNYNRRKVITGFAK